MLLSFCVEIDFIYRIGWNLFTKKKIFDAIAYVRLFLRKPFEIFRLENCFCRQILFIGSKRLNKNSSKIGFNFIRMFEFFYLFFRLFTRMFVTYRSLLNKYGKFVNFNDFRGGNRVIGSEKGGLLGHDRPKLKKLTYKLGFNILNFSRGYLIYFFYFLVRFITLGFLKKSTVLGFACFLDYKALNFNCFFNDLGTLVVSSTIFQILHDYFDWEDNFFFISFNLKLLKSWVSVFLSSFRLL